jgi:hypothetical protein
VPTDLRIEIRSYKIEPCLRICGLKSVATKLNRAYGTTLAIFQIGLCVIHKKEIEMIKLTKFLLRRNDFSEWDSFAACILCVKMYRHCIVKKRVFVSRRLRRFSQMLYHANVGPRQLWNAMIISFGCWLTPTTAAVHFNCEAIIFSPLKPFVLLCELCAFRTFGSVEQLASRKAPQ